MNIVFGDLHVLVIVSFSYDVRKKSVIDSNEYRYLIEKNDM